MEHKSISEYTTLKLIPKEDMSSNVEKLKAAVVVTAIVASTAVGLVKLDVDKQQEQQKTEQRSK